METDLIGRIIALIAALGAFFASVIAATARKKAEYVKIRLKRFEDKEMMKRRYSTPLLNPRMNYTIRSTASSGNSLMYLVIL